MNRFHRVSLALVTLALSFGAGPVHGQLLPRVLETREPFRPGGLVHVYIVIGGGHGVPQLGPRGLYEQPYYFQGAPAGFCQVGGTGYGVFGGGTVLSAYTAPQSYPAGYGQSFASPVNFGCNGQALERFQPGQFSGQGNPWQPGLQLPGQYSLPWSPARGH